MPDGWDFDASRWPGPNREEFGITRDVVLPSPDGRFAGVLYSCAEIGIGREVGLFAVLEGPPHSPKLILRPDLTCWDFFDGSSLQWLGGSTYLAARAYEPSALVFVDVVRRRFAFHERGSLPLHEDGRTWVDDAGVRIVPEDLRWKGWWRWW